MHIIHFWRKIKKISGKRKKLGEVKMAVLAVDSNSADCICGQHIFSMSRTVDPAGHSTLHRVIWSHTIRNIFRKRLFEKLHFIWSLIKTSMTYRDHTIGHCNAMLHCNIVQLLIPWKCRQTTLLLSELIGQIEGPNSPLLWFSRARFLCIGSYSHLLIYFVLDII